MGNKLRWIMDIFADIQAMGGLGEFLKSKNLDLEKIIVPDDCPGKVRCLEVKVLREVPLEECGIYGKMIAKRLNKESNKNA